MKRTPTKKDRVPVKRPRLFWIHDTLHRIEVINKFLNIKLTMAVVSDVFLRLEKLKDRRNQNFFLALMVSSFRAAGFSFLTGGLTKLVTVLTAPRDQVRPFFPISVHFCC